MIAVVYNRKHHRLTVSGHAYSGQPGHDLVCASASILAYTLAAAVSNISASPEKQIREPKVVLQEGSAEISCKPVKRFDAVITMIFDTICGGFELLSINYPDYISYGIEM